MDYWEGCKELALIVVEINEPEIAAYKIQAFCEAIGEGETVKMALTMAKKTMEADEVMVRLPSLNNGRER